jgi:IstB-like ATP binding protein
MSRTDDIIELLTSHLCVNRPHHSYLNSTLCSSHLFLTAVSFSASRKRLWSVTEEVGRAAKRKEIDGDAHDAQICCVAIHGAIKAMPDDLDLSNPSTFTTLPFSSLLPMPSQRFEKRKINGVQQFEYMGRSMFRELQMRIEKGAFLDGNESLYLYGTSGSGKSHLLAALVYHLIRKGERVFYIPDCSSLLLEPAETMLAAFHFAFYDSPVLETIGDPHDVGALIRIMSKHRDLYIIVDQVNTLELIEKDSCKARKEQALDWLRSLRYKHRYIFGASANENSNRDADRKQSGISVCRIFGGMSRVC